MIRDIFIVFASPPARLPADEASSSLVYIRMTSVSEEEREKEVADSYDE